MTPTRRVQTGVATGAGNVPSPRAAGSRRDGTGGKFCSRWSGKGPEVERRSDGAPAYGTRTRLVPLPARPQIASENTSFGAPYDPTKRAEQLRTVRGGSCRAVVSQEAAYGRIQRKMDCAASTAERSLAVGGSSALEHGERQPPTGTTPSLRAESRRSHGHPGGAAQDRQAVLGAAAVCLALACGETTAPRRASVLDLRGRGETEAGVARIYGSVGDGSAGLPVAGGGDVDGDGRADTLFGAMQADGQSVRAGQVFLILGSGEIVGGLDTGREHSRIVVFRGRGAHELAGSEVWMDDVTGDGLADLLIARQNFTHVGPGNGPPRIGAGALTIVAGDPALRALAQRGEPVDLGAEGPLSQWTLYGAAAGDRLGIWMRTGDVDGDGVADIVVGADQDDGAGDDAGAAIVVLGGAHLAMDDEVSLSEALAAPGSSALAGRVMTLRPPEEPSARNFHFGATCQVADLDGNGRAEVLVAAALNRAGASLDPAGGTDGEGVGGSRHGTVYILWDSGVPAPPWPPNFGVSLGSGPDVTRLLGGDRNVSFGEELLGGYDWDADGNADLFVGDLAAWRSASGFAGMAHVIYDARALRGLDGDFDSLGEVGIASSTFLGADGGHIAGDTAAAGDFNGDGVDDLVFSSPHASPLGRASAGAIHVLQGRTAGWGAFHDLAAPTPELALREVYGAKGGAEGDVGDTLCYSAATGDLDGDGRTDLITNEMTGDGLGPESVDVGNLLLIGGTQLLP